MEKNGEKYAHFDTKFHYELCRTVRSFNIQLESNLSKYNGSIIIDIGSVQIIYARMCI